MPTKKSIFSEIRDDYTDDNGVRHLDGYRTPDDNENGETIAFILNGKPYYRNPEYQFDPMVIEAIAEIEKENAAATMPVEITTPLNPRPNIWEVSEGGTTIWGVSPLNARVKIATVIKHSPMNGIDSEANAHLMAASPELLAMLESYIKWGTWYSDLMAERHGSGSDECGSHGNGTGLQFRALYLVAKAKNELPSS